MLRSTGWTSLSWAPSPLLKLDGVITQKEEREAAGLRVAGQIPLAWQIMSEFVGQRELLWRPPKRVSQQAYHGPFSHGCSAFVDTSDLPSNHQNPKIPICYDCQVCCHRLPFFRDVDFFHQIPTVSVHRVFLVRINLKATFPVLDGSVPLADVSC